MVKQSKLIRNLKTRVILAAATAAWGLFRLVELVSPSIPLVEVNDLLAAEINKGWRLLKASR